MLALLSAAYGKAIAPSVLGNIERAAKAWREGDARLPEPNDPAEDPTPRRMGYRLLKPDDGSSVAFDDCQHSTGIMVEAKGDYANLLEYQETKTRDEWLKQSAAQVAHCLLLSSQHA